MCVCDLGLCAMCVMCVCDVCVYDIYTHACVYICKCRFTCTVTCVEMEVHCLCPSLPSCLFVLSTAGLGACRDLPVSAARLKAGLEDSAVAPRITRVWGLLPVSAIFFRIRTFSSALNCFFAVAESLTRASQRQCVMALGLEVQFFLEDEHWDRDSGTHALSGRKRKSAPQAVEQARD